MQACRKLTSQGVSKPFAWKIAGIGLVVLLMLFGAVAFL